MNSANPFRVSVIIPVFNAKKFLLNAVESAVHLDEVGEIILVEDCSQDDSLKTCEELQNKYSKIKLFRHSIRENLGAAASRNLGIRKSIYEFIAFLDADNWYLPNRFKSDKEVFLKYLNADVAYSSVQRGENNKTSLKNVKIGDPRKIIGEKAKAEDFFKFSLVKKQHPSFHINSLTIRRKFIIEDKLFDERLVLHQDSEMWRRFLRRGNFYAAKLDEPVAVIRKKEQNKITSRSVESRLTMYSVLIENIGVDNMFDFEKEYYVKEILRSRSQLFANNARRRLFYYVQLVFSLPRKDIFLKKFSTKVLSNHYN